MDMNIQKYKAFVTTVSCGSFTKAAEILNYSQSGISRMIHDLEKEWKVILLKRSKLGVRLTSSGMKLLPYAENVCKEYEKLQTEVDELQGLKSGLIRIGTFSSVATHWLPNIIREFQKDYPEIDYEMLLGDYTEIEEWILEGRVDCGFLRLPTHAELDTVFLEQDRLLVVLPEGHPLAEYRKIPVSALCEEPFMLLEKGAKAEVSEIFERSHLTPKVHGGGRTRDQCFAGTDPEEDSLQDCGKRAGNPGIPEYRTGDEKQEDSTACGTEIFRISSVQTG